MTGLRRTWWLSILALMATACHSDSTGPTTLSVSPSASIAFGTKGRSVTMHAAVIDQKGDTAAGRAFTWLTSNGSVVAVSLSAGDSAVLTSTGSGTATVTVSSGGLQKPITVTVTLIAASATDSGNMQVASAGMRLDAPLVLLLKDSLGNAARGDTVTFAVGGGGSLTSTKGVSDVNGRVTTSWTLGASGAQTVTASAAGGFNHVFSAALVPASTNTTSFNIQVVNVGPAFSPAVQAAFDSAAAFWGRTITGDLTPDSIGEVPEGAFGCGSGFPAVGPLKIDDVVIMAIVRPIDGAGGILGGAGPCVLRTSGTNPDTTEPTLLGAMEFDSADVATLVANGELDEVIRHEMAHVLGFGTFWAGFLVNEAPGLPLYGRGCLQDSTATRPGPDTYYNCANGLAWFDSIGGNNYTLGNKVPVENCASGVPTSCGGGTFDSHWRESVFGAELMTGYLNSGVPNPVSKLTIGQFMDLGYTGVDVTKAETYTQVFTAPSAFRLITAGVSLGNDMRMPRFAKPPAGRIVRIRPPTPW